MYQTHTTETMAAIPEGENDPQLKPFMVRTSSSTRVRSRRVVLLGIGAVIMGAFYTASWVPWTMSQKYGAGPVDVSREGSDRCSSGPGDFSWGSVRIYFSLN